MQKQEQYILTINAGSSTIKYQLFTTDSLEVVVKGLIDKIGETGNSNIKQKSSLQKTPLEKHIPIHNFEEALQCMFDCIPQQLSENKQWITALRGIGFRVVHGGDVFTESRIISEEVLQTIEELSDVAPLHNPIAVKAIKACQSLFRKQNVSIPKLVAVFDTTFHIVTMPEKAYRYAIGKTKAIEQQETLHHEKIRRYGFHGISYSFIWKSIANYLPKEVDRDSYRLIAMHLGNGCSITAMEGGKSKDTSMGFSPLEGLISGTRSGDLDACIPLRHLGFNDDTVKAEQFLNKECGLKGLCGSNDMREIISRVQEKQDADASMALEMFCYRIAKYIGSYMMVLNGCDGICFSAGIGENASLVREKNCNYLQWCGGELDPQRNQKIEFKDNSAVVPIHSSNSKLQIFVVATNEEHEIALQTLQFLN